MRFKQIIKETTDQKELLEKYFEVKGAVEFTPEGINVDGKVKSKPDLSLSELPVKFNKINDEFNIEISELRNLNNFPNLAGTIVVKRSTQLANLSSIDETINCRHFMLVGVHTIKDFTNSNLKISSVLTLINCNNIELLTGLSLDTIKSVYIDSCLSFREDLGSIPSLKDVSLRGSFSNDMPIMRLFATKKLKIEKGYFTNPTGVEEILIKYKNSGPRAAIMLMHELKANGFLNAARL